MDFITQSFSSQEGLTNTRLCHTGWWYLLPVCDSGAKRRRPWVVKQAGHYQPNLRRVWSATIASASLNNGSFQWTSKDNKEQVMETVVTISGHTLVFWSTSTHAQGMLEASPISFTASGSVIMVLPLSNGKTLTECVNLIHKHCKSVQ